MRRPPVDVGAAGGVGWTLYPMVCLNIGVRNIRSRCTGVLVVSSVVCAYDLVFWSVLLLNFDCHLCVATRNRLLNHHLMLVCPVFRTSSCWITSTTAQPNAWYRRRVWFWDTAFVVVARVHNIAVCAQQPTRPHLQCMVATTLAFVLSAGA